MSVDVRLTHGISMKYTMLEEPVEAERLPYFICSDTREDGLPVLFQNPETLEHSTLDKHSKRRRTDNGLQISEKHDGFRSA